MNGGAGPKVAIGCGSILLFLAFCVSAFGAYHVFVDPHGHISADEAMPALLGGVLCMLVDFVIVVVGIVLVMRGGSSASGGGMAAPPSVGSMPGGPGAQGGFPWHLAGGCGSLFFLVTLCSSLSFAGYSISEAQRWEENYSYDVSTGSDPMLLMIDQGAIERHQQEAGAGGCCCVLSFLLAAGCVGGTVTAVRRRRAAGA